MIDILVRLDDISNVLSKGKRRFERIPDANILSLDASIPPENCPLWCLSEEAKAKFNIRSMTPSSSATIDSRESRKYKKKRKSNNDESKDDNTESSSDSSEKATSSLSKKSYNKRHRQRKYKEKHR